MALMIWKVLCLCCQKISFDRLAGESITCIYKGWSNELGELEADEVRESFSLKLLGFVHSLEWLLWFSTKWKGIFFSVPGKRFLWLLLLFFFLEIAVSIDLGSCCACYTHRFLSLGVSFMFCGRQLRKAQPFELPFQLSSGWLVGKMGKLLYTLVLFS